MKTKWSYIVWLWLLLLVLPLAAKSEDVRPFDRNHWREVKRGLRYDPNPRNDSYNRNWADNFDEKEEAGKANRGFGKYSSGDKDFEAQKDYFSREAKSPKATPASNGLSSGMKIALIVGISVVLGFLIYRIILDSRKGGKKIKPTDETLPETEDAVELPRSELEIRLEAAVNAEDYREAIRIYFIFIIKSLREHNWIHWEKKKTNRLYLLEMRDRPNYRQFSEAISLFEVIWYGRRQLNREEYLRIQPLFQQLLTAIR